MSEQAQEEKKPTVDEVIAARTEQLNQVDSSIITIQRLISSGKIKIIEETDQENPLSLSVTGKEMINSMLSPALDKLLRDRGSLSFDIERFKAVKEQESK